MENSNIYSVWKPSGITSYDVIRKIKKNYKSLNKIGHCGTLDPFAEGVLLICTGNKVKDSSKYMNLMKTYIADFIFGEETDTLDSTGVTYKKSIKKPTISVKSLENTLNKFKGSYIQSPPYYSAKKINGIRMYELARKNIFVKPKGSYVDIYSIDLINFEENVLKIKIKCGSGMYVRSLARDIAYDLDTYAFVDTLKRIKIGDYDIKNSMLYDDIGN